jgi:hypothetical protein
MRKHWILLLPCLFLTHLFADDSQDQTPLVPPEQLEKELAEAQKEFEEAKKMFNPWYTGPLITPSATVLQPPQVVVQPFFSYTNNYARYDKHGHPHGIPHLKVLNPSMAAVQVGITKWMDASLSFQGIRNIQHGHAYTNWGDTSVTVGFGLLTETPYRPAIKLAVKEIFPTGHYQHFNLKKANVESTGAGSYQTVASLNLSKVVWWLTTHPMAFRTSLNYTIPSNVPVAGFNTYGGAKGTHGTVNPGNIFAGDFGYEYSFTQRWVAALDVVYTYTGKTRFSGHRTAPVGGPFNDQLSLAPALEYNVSEKLGFIAGVWFPVWGRNSLKFFSEIVSLTYTF